MRSFIVALTLAGAPAWAQDEPETETDSFDLGIDLDDIDLGGGGPDEISYTGGLDKAAPQLANGKAVTISHTGGSVRVNCADREGLAARLMYTVYGTNGPNMKRFGDGIGLSAWGSSSNGGVKTRVPGKGSGVTSAEIDLIVQLPKEAYVRVNGGYGQVSVAGCKGSVAAANRKGDLTVQGTYTRIDLTAASGDITVDLEDDSLLDGTNKLSAPGGSVDLELPMSYGGRFYAKGSEVNVFHTVIGTNESNLVQGTVSTGNASLTITAKGAVKVETP